MLHSLRLRLLLAMVALVAVTAGAVALLARQFTVAEFQRYLALESERSQRVGDLFAAASRLDGQDPAAQAAAAAAMSARAGERVILADASSMVVADSAGEVVGRPVASLGGVEAIVVQFGAPQHAMVDLPALPPALSGATASISATDTLAIVGAPTMEPGAVHNDTRVLFYTAPITRDLEVSGVALAGAPIAVTWSRFAAPDPIEAGFVSGVNRSLGLAVGVAGVAALLLTAALSRRIIGPIAELTAAAERMATGDLSRRVAVRTNDEIAALGRAFNSMAAALERAEDLRRVMVGDVAHELRTPLTNIRGYLEALRDGVAQPDDRTLASLHEEALLLSRLIDDLQDLALADAGQLRLCRQPAHLGAVAERALAAALPRLEAKGVSCALRVAPELPAADVDPERIGQVLRNLLNNALTHTPAGGAVTVEVARAPGEGQQALAVTVADTGCGIAAEDLPLIFERFYRADRSRARATGGAGLGLTIVRRLVEAHGGAVSATSAPGEGARFTFTVPVAP